MKKSKNFEYEDESPFMIKFFGREYFVYIKNITPAYFKKLPDITRVQLPYRPHYKRILNSSVPFIILGYDKEKQIFVNWDPFYIKGRLNSKSNVSLYSKKSLQQQIHEDLIYEMFNSNGHKLVMFKKELLPIFFSTFEDIYNKNNSLEQPKTSMENAVDKNILMEITDPTLLQMITPHLSQNNILKAVEICGRYYKDTYKSMGFKEWFSLINKLLQK